MTEAYGFEVRLQVLSEDGDVIENLNLDYDIPSDELDLEDSLMYLASDLKGTLKQYLPRA